MPFASVSRVRLWVPAPPRLHICDGDGDGDDGDGDGGDDDALIRMDDGGVWPSPTCLRQEGWVRDRYIYTQMKWRRE